MSSENHINLRKDEETIRKEILCNICRMLIRRGRMDEKKYRMVNGKYAHENEGAVPLTKDDNIDVTLFDFIKKRTDDNMYHIPLDVEYKDERLYNPKKTEAPDFDGSKVVVKMIRQKVSDVGSSPVLNDFLKSNSKFHKIIIFDSISDKAKASLRKKKNVEFFERDTMLIDLMSYICSPEECKVVTEDDIKHIINPKVSKILENDHLAEYYRAKKGSILRIVRPNSNSGQEIAYRRVVNAKPVFR